MPPHSFTNFEIQIYYQNDGQLSSNNEPRFNGVYSKSKLPEVNDGAYVIKNKLKIQRQQKYHNKYL